MQIVRVAIDVPLAQTFDYRAAASVGVGQRVVVPFGKRNVIGIALELADGSDIAPERLRNVARVLPHPRLGEPDLRLLRFASDYYHYPLGQVVMNALPQRLKRAAAIARAAPYFSITDAGLSALLADLPPRAKVQRKVLESLHAQRVLAPDDMKAFGPRGRAAVEDFVLRGWVERI